MSKIAFDANDQGTGVLTIASPDTNNNRTLTLPDETGTVLTSASTINGANVTGLLTGKHFFHAYRNADQTVSNGVNTIALFDTEVADVSSAYNTSTGQFTVPEDGLYFFVTSITHGSSGNTNLWNGNASIRKNNGTQINMIFNYAANYPNEVTHQVSGIVDCTAGDVMDVEFYVETSSGSGGKAVGGKTTYFLGVMIA